MLLGHIGALEIHLVAGSSARRMRGRSAIEKFLERWQSNPAALKRLSGFLRERGDSPAQAAPVADRIAALITGGQALLEPSDGQLLWRHAVSSQSRFSALEFLRQFSTSPVAMWNLRAFVWKCTVAPDLGRIDDGRILEQVASWVASGEAVVGFRKRLRGGEAMATEAPAPSTTAAAVAPRGARDSSAPKIKEKTWVAIKLIDKDGKPVPGASYKVKLPDASVVTGALNEKGEVQFDDIDPGQCLITFPEIDAKEWN
jgi:hypothetical protein